MVDLLVEITAAIETWAVVQEYATLIQILNYEDRNGKEDRAHVLHIASVQIKQAGTAAVILLDNRNMII
jgi:hypothetical protein